MSDKKGNLISQARSWAAKNKLHGVSAFSRFVMFKFVQQLNQSTDEYVFKGGNLLWIYIKTPRATVDVDFVTKTINTHELLRASLEQACAARSDGIIFSLSSFKSIDRPDGSGAAVIIHYETDTGQKNSFDVDIVLCIPTRMVSIPSPLGNAEDEITVSTLENIIADKLAASQKFKSGNTRLKDFDDLWRISQYRPDLVNWQDLNAVLSERKIKSELDLEWINPLMEKSWLSHLKRNKGLPVRMSDLINDVNRWLLVGLSANES